MQPGRGQLHTFSLAMTRPRSVTLAGPSMILKTGHTRLARRNQISSGCTTCTAMRRSGWRIPGTTTTMVRRQMLRLGPKAEMRTAAWFTVVRGTPNLIGSAQPFVGETSPTVGRGYAVSASRGPQAVKIPTANVLSDLPNAVEKCCGAFVGCWHPFTVRCAAMVRQISGANLPCWRANADACC